MNIDLLVTNVQIFNSFNRQFESGSIAISEGKFFYRSQEELSYLNPKEVLDGGNRYMIPGLLDIHMHIESSMTLPSIFSKAALTYGVTTIVADAHEVANVFGIAGLKEYFKGETELDIFQAIPSSVPSTTKALETTGGVIELAEVAELLDSPEVVCLGEAMNFKGIVSQPASLIRQIIALVQEKHPRMPIEGHVPRITGEELARFSYQGVTADHTHQSPESILEKVYNGMFIELQSKSITPETIKTVVDHQLYEYMALITDDVMADDLLTSHLNGNIKKAVACGLPIEWAIYMSTYTPARRIGFQDRGAIAPGLLADFILLDDLTTFEIAAVYKKGQLVHRQGEAIQQPAVIEEFPPEYYQSVKCRLLTPADLKIEAPETATEADVNVMAIQAVGTFTTQESKTLPVVDGYINWEDSGLALIIVMERYGLNGNIAYGFVDQALHEKGAVATTWAHDHHNLMVMGTDSASILEAQKTLLALQGGYVVVNQGELVATCPLPIGGILSAAPLAELGQNLKDVRQGMVDLGYRNGNEIMSFSTLSLPVSPEIKITDKGMMATKSQELIPLIRRFR